MVNFATLGNSDQTGDQQPAATQRDYADELIDEIEAEQAADHSPFIPGSGPAPVEAVEESKSTAAATITPAEPVFGAPMITMWLAPRRTIRGVLHEGSFIVVLLLGALAGAAGTLFDSIGADETPVLSELLMDSLTLGPLLGIFALLLGAGIFWLTGKLFSGPARFSDLCAVTAWSRVPLLFMGLFVLATVLVVGPTALSGDGVEAVLLQLGEWVFGIWATVLFVGALAEAQGWSLGKTILNCVVTLAGVFVIVMILVFLAVLVGVGIGLSGGLA